MHTHTAWLQPANLADQNDCTCDNDARNSLIFTGDLPLSITADANYMSAGSGSRSLWPEVLSRRSDFRTDARCPLCACVCERACKRKHARACVTRSPLVTLCVISPDSRVNRLSSFENFFSERFFSSSACFEKFK